MVSESRGRRAWTSVPFHAPRRAKTRQDAPRCRRIFRKRVDGVLGEEGHGPAPPRFTSGQRAELQLRTVMRPGPESLSSKERRKGLGCGDGQQPKQLPGRFSPRCAAERDMKSGSECPPERGPGWSGYPSLTADAETFLPHAYYKGISGERLRGVGTFYMTRQRRAGDKRFTRDSDLVRQCPNDISLNAQRLPLQLPPHRASCCLRMRPACSRMLTSGMWMA